MSSLVTGRRVFAAFLLASALFAVQQLTYRGTSAANPSSLVRKPFLVDKFRGEDAVTRAIRSESNGLTRLFVRDRAEREAAGRLGKIVEDYGSFVLVAKNRELRAKSFGMDEQAVETTVHLPGTSFEPAAQAPRNSLRLGEAAVAPEGGYYVVQFGGTATDEWLRSVANAGVEVLQYVPHQAYFVYGDAESIARIANHSRVRWIGAYTADQKITPTVRRQIDATRGGRSMGRSVSPIKLSTKGTAIFDVSVFARADLESVAAELQQRFGKGEVRPTRLQHNFFNLVRVELSLDDVDRVAEMADVFSLDPVVPAQNEDERSNQILAGNYLNNTTLNGSHYDPLAQFGTDGSNVTVSVVDDGVGIPGDGGFYITPSNAVNGPLRGSSAGAMGHGHLNATIIAGSTPYGPFDSGFYNYGLGVAPGANIINIPRNRIGYNGSNAQVYDDSVSNPGPNGGHGLISNNSWGFPRDGSNGNSYEQTEAEFDKFVRDASDEESIDPITLIFSAGNDGANGLTRPKAAKNLIVVGNSESLRSDKGGNGANNIDDIAVDSSRGPTTDGRIKPDIVAPGTAITGGRSGPITLLGNIDSAHRWSSGTSHSAAHVTGIAALFTRWWYDRNFNDRPSPSLIRAALINSAVDMNGDGTSAPIPNGVEGWGRPNLKRMLTPGVGMKYIDEQVPLQSTGDVFPLVGSVADGTKPLRVTLAWTDPPGTTNPALVNNLDLIVIVNGVEYKGNVFSNGVSVAGGAADTVNNVENVFLPAGIPSGASLEIRVVATALQGDGILANGDATDQNYSLVVHNWSGLTGPSFYRVAGRVISPNGRGIAGARVRITDSLAVTREMTSNHSGYFTFTNVAGGNYTINVTSKKYTFVQRVENVSGNLSNLVITSSNGLP